MAYKPKYLATQKKGAPNWLAFLIAPVSLFLVVSMLAGMLTGLGSSKKTTLNQSGDITIMENFDRVIAAQVGSVENVQQQPEGGVPVAPQETTPVRQHYTLDDTVQVAPEPNRDKFGETDDPSTLGWLLEDAAEILDGQKTYFNTDIQIFAGSKVMYYLDETIFAVTWKEVRDGCVYTFSEVKVCDASQFRRHLAGGEYSSEVQYMTTEMAETVNAVVASSGDFHRFRNFGICVYEGELKKMDGTYAETCFIDVNGDMHFVYGGEITTKAKAREYIEANDIRFSLCFGPVLVDNYEIVEHSWYGIGEIAEGYARAALCQMDDLHYIVVTANTEGGYQLSPKVKTFAKNIASTGCKMAYCLDGGQTAAIVMNDQLINRPVYGTQRKISDIIYFATAVPEEG